MAYVQYYIVLNVLLQRVKPQNVDSAECRLNKMATQNTQNTHYQIV